MLRLLALVISIGIADSLNPSTIAPALFLAGGERPREEVAEFTIAVFAVYLVGGLAIALGPGQLLLSLIPHPTHHVGYILELIAGVSMLAAASFLWGYRDRLAQREVPTPTPEGKSSAILGATITAVELPTAFPYFAAIAAVVGSGLDPVRQVVLLVIFNVCFVLPLVGIVGVLTFGGENANNWLTTWRNWLESRWPAVLATLALLAGVFVTLLGVTGLGALAHNHLGRLARHFRRLFHLHT
jgi:cytochrome c biogenesis protein CcdA